MDLRGFLLVLGWWGLGGEGKIEGKVWYEWIVERKECGYGGLFLLLVLIECCSFGVAQGWSSDRSAPQHGRRSPAFIGLGNRFIRFLLTTDGCKEDGLELCLVEGDSAMST